MTLLVTSQLKHRRRHHWWKAFSVTREMEALAEAAPVTFSAFGERRALWEMPRALAPLECCRFFRCRAFSGSRAVFCLVAHTPAEAMWVGPCITDSIFRSCHFAWSREVSVAHCATDGLVNNSLHAFYANGVVVLVRLWTRSSPHGCDSMPSRDHACASSCWFPSRRSTYSSLWCRHFSAPFLASAPHALGLRNLRFFFFFSPLGCVPPA